MKIKIFIAILFCIIIYGCNNQKYNIENDKIAIEWKDSEEAGYAIEKVVIKKNNNINHLLNPSGKYTVLFSAGKPDSITNLYQEEASVLREWLNPITLNTAGTAISFFPKKAVKKNDKEILFKHETDTFSITSKWSIDPEFKNDILISITLNAKKSGYFSISSPALAHFGEDSLQWGMIPGYFQGKNIENDLIKCYRYGMGIPKEPLVVKDKAATTLISLLTDEEGNSLAVVPNPEYGRDPVKDTVITHNDWILGLSLRSRDRNLSPTLFYPVLGQENSWINKGDSINFSFRFIVGSQDWYTITKHVIYDVFNLKNFLQLKENEKSLTSRILSMVDYLTDNSTSLWNNVEHHGKTIGAQAYLGPGIAGFEFKPMKNSDYGAMWMLAEITQNENLQQEKLPYARNFKIAQQNSDTGFFKGSLNGQYYLIKKGEFIEEMGHYVEPIAITFYVMCDIGNMLLFQPDDKILKDRLKYGAEKLLDWQKSDGSWEVAYDKKTKTLSFPDLNDLRPTFYGLLIAYELLGDQRYLDGAIKGANWFLENAVKKGHYLGVCGDVRFKDDFAKAQSAEALLELFNITKDEKYKEAAIEVAKLYITHIYTHPIATNETKYVKGKKRKDWEISQVGLNFEHGGVRGSTNYNGPILLSSHAGMFLRFYKITQDSLFIDLARAAAIGRHAFVDSKTSVASYYWKNMDQGPGMFPHHAWWQIGWITDYIISEINVRSNNKINFPSGFFTPKVGPHKCYGFEPGVVYGDSANLYLNSKIKISNPNIDYFGAKSIDNDKEYLMLINSNIKPQTVDIDLSKLNIVPSSIELLNDNEFEIIDTKSNIITVDIDKFGIQAIRF